LSLNQRACCIGAIRRIADWLQHLEIPEEIDSEDGPISPYAATRRDAVQVCAEALH
jgi:hypothetical protein